MSRGFVAEFAMRRSRCDAEAEAKIHMAWHGFWNRHDICKKHLVRYKGKSRGYAIGVSACNVPRRLRVCDTARHDNGRMQVCVRQ